MTMDRTARYVVGLVGAWSFASAFLWHHSPAQFTNTAVVGLTTALLAALAAAVPPVRVAIAALAAWLVISAFVLPADRVATMVHNALAGLMILAAALAGGSDTIVPRRRTGPPALP